MSKESKATKLARSRNVILGLRKTYKPGDIIMIDGVGHTRDEVIAIFQGHIDALSAKDTRYAEYRTAVALERKLARQVLALWLHLQRFFTASLGPHGPPKFGMEAPKKPGPKTTAAKLAGVQKRAKTRAPK
jgi:hypothetical protein